MYLNDQLIRQNVYPDLCFCSFYFSNWLTVYDGFTLQAGGPIRHGELTAVQVAGTLTVDCSEIVWHPELPMTLTIIEGTTLGEFVDTAGASLGTSVTKKASELSTIRFSANGQEPSGGGGRVTIQGVSAGITGQISFSVLPSVPVDHFTITFEKDEVAFTETSKSFVQAKDANDQDMSLSDSELLTFTLGGESAYGTFINAAGDTVKTSPVVLEAVRYGDAKSGGVKFAAVALNPVTSAHPIVEVALQSDPSVAGQKAITVIEQTLKIVMEAPLEVQPRIPSGGTLPVLPSNRKSFAVRLTRGGILVGDHPFTLTTNYVDGSGGHDHPNRRAESNENFGYLISRQNGREGRPLSEQTLSNVMNAFEYAGSVWGDIMWIIVRSDRHQQLLRDSVNVLERVPNLAELGTGQHFELVGAPHNHAGTNDPCRPVAPTSEHSRNHFGTQALIAAIQNIAAAYDSLHSGVRLRINDMSLELGGLFDFRNNWRAPHREHRVGRNADIGFNGINNLGVCVSTNRRQLRRIIQEQTNIRPLPESDHYHIYSN